MLGPFLYLVRGMLRCLLILLLMSILRIVDTTFTLSIEDFTRLLGLRSWTSFIIQTPLAILSALQTLAVMVASENKRQISSACSFLSTTLNYVSQYTHAILAARSSSIVFDAIVILLAFVETVFLCSIFWLVLRPILRGSLIFVDMLIEYVRPFWMVVLRIPMNLVGTDLQQRAPGQPQSMHTPERDSLQLQSPLEDGQPIYEMLSIEAISRSTPTEQHGVSSYGNRRDTDATTSSVATRQALHDYVLDIQQSEHPNTSPSTDGRSTRTGSIFSSNFVNPTSLTRHRRSTIVIPESPTASLSFLSDGVSGTIDEQDEE